MYSSAVTLGLPRPAKIYGFVVPLYPVPISPLKVPVFPTLLTWLPLIGSSCQVVSVPVT